jgi:hypothetical protein
MKECFDNDLDVLKKAYNSDIELANLLNNLIAVHIAKIWDVLELKGLITEEEKIQFLHEVKEQLDEGKQA